MEMLEGLPDVCSKGYPRVSSRLLLVVSDYFFVFSLMGFLCYAFIFSCYMEGHPASFARDPASLSIFLISTILYSS